MPGPDHLDFNVPTVDAQLRDARRENARIIAERDAARAAADAMRRVLASLRSWCIPGMDWTDDIGRELLAQADAVLAVRAAAGLDTPGKGEDHA